MESTGGHHRENEYPMSSSNLWALTRMFIILKKLKNWKTFSKDKQLREKHYTSLKKKVKPLELRDAGRSKECLSNYSDVGPKKKKYCEIKNTNDKKSLHSDKRNHLLIRLK